MLTRILLLAVLIAAIPTAPARAQSGAAAPDMPAPVRSGLAPVNGTEVYYAVYGEGEPLVLLHSGFQMIEDFGSNLAMLAEARQVIGVDLQGHGRTPLGDRPLSFEAMAADIAELIRYLGFEKADVMGYSLGGETALRLVIDHPEVVDRLVLVSTPFAFAGWHDFNSEGMRMLGEASAEAMKPTPMYSAYAAVASDPERGWSRLHVEMGRLANEGFDWSADIPAITRPTMLVVGDWDAVRTAHTAAFFELLGGGTEDALWDRSGMNQNRLAILPNVTHYEIGTDPRLATTVIPFLDAP